MTRRLVEGGGVDADPDHFTTSLSPDLLAGVRRRIRWTAAVRGVRLQDDAVDDLAQDLLLRLWERGVPREVEDFPAYVLRAASNLTIDAVRRDRAKKRETPASTDCGSAVSGPAWPATPEQTAIGREGLRHKLAECRSLLSARKYRIFALTYLAGCTNREVAASVGLRPGNVDSILFRLRRALKGSGLVPRTRASRCELEVLKGRPRRGTILPLDQADALGTSGPAPTVVALFSRTVAFPSKLTAIQDAEHPTSGGHSLYSEHSRSRSAYAQNERASAKADGFE